MQKLRGLVKTVLYSVMQWRELDAHALAGPETIGSTNSASSDGYALVGNVDARRRAHTALAVKWPRRLPLSHLRVTSL